MSKLGDKLVAVAKKEVGVEEVHSSNCGPRVNEYKSATNLPPNEAWPWCAAFVCWCLREAMKGGTYTFKRPTTAGAWSFEDWSRSQDNSTNTRKPAGSDIQSGDIVIFTFSHIGIATSSPDHDGYFKTVEGNTDSSGSREGGGVFAKNRKISQVRCRIRFTV